MITNKMLSHFTKQIRVTKQIGKHFIKLRPLYIPFRQYSTTYNDDTEIIYKYIYEDEEGRGDEYFNSEEKILLKNEYENFDKISPQIKHFPIIKEENPFSFSEKDFIIKIPQKYSQMRLDNFLQKIQMEFPKWNLNLKKLSNSFIQSIIRKGKVKINSKRIKDSNFRIYENDELRIPKFIVDDSSKTIDQMIVLDSPKFTISEKLQNEIKKWILFINDEVIVINKPYGIPTRGIYSLNLQIKKK